jgi:hypothetical protein
MMTRAERIEYEILDCALNRARGPAGWPTSLEQFLTQLRDLFPDAESQELIETCKGLAMQQALILRKQEPGRRPIYHDYRGYLDDESFFGETHSELRFQEAPMSRYRLKNLTAMITFRAG